jgi:hypothetical protein
MLTLLESSRFSFFGVIWKPESTPVWSVVGRTYSRELNNSQMKKNSFVDLLSYRVELFIREHAGHFMTSRKQAKVKWLLIALFCVFVLCTTR